MICHRENGRQVIVTMIYRLLPCKKYPIKLEFNPLCETLRAKNQWT